MASQEEDFRTSFEKMGVNQVRADFVGWTGPFRGAAIQWLAEKDQEASRLAEAARREEMEFAKTSNALAREANDFASRSIRLVIISNVIATIALIVATIALIKG